MIDVTNPLQLSCHQGARSAGPSSSRCNSTRPHLSSSFLSVNSLQRGASKPISLCSRQTQRPSLLIAQAFDPKGNGAAGILDKVNNAYVVIFGVFAALFLFHNPYIFAVLSIVTIIPQNSAVTSLNTLVNIFYESGFFMNFAEAVTCVRLITWLSIICTLISFAIFT